jgi:protein required for attachment to host cells
MKKTWILVADSAHARIFEAEAVNAPLHEIRDFSNAEAHLKNVEIDSDRPGRGAGGDAHHAMDTTSDSKEHEIESFARFIANELDHARTQNNFAQLIIVAAPSFLGQIREVISEPLSKMVSYELDKNLSKMESDEIRQHLPEILPSYAV